MKNLYTHVCLIDKISGEGYLGLCMVDICDKQISDDGNDIDNIDGNYTNIFVHKEESTCIDGNHKSKYTEYDFCSECFDKIATMFNVTPTVREEPW